MSTQLQLALNRRAELDARIAALLAPASALTDLERRVLGILVYAPGRASAIPARVVAARLGMPWNENARRDICQAVKDLVEFFHIPIGASRGKVHGYFLVLDADDQRIATRALEGEFFSLLRRLRRLASKRFVAELYGQAVLALDREDAGTSQQPSADTTQSSRGAV